MHRVVFACVTLSLLSGCATWDAYHGRAPFTPQPVLSPPASDINANGGPYTVPPAATPKR